MSKEKNLESLEDYLLATLRSNDAADAYNFVRQITAEVALLTSYQFTDAELAFLKTVIDGNLDELTNEQKVSLRYSLAEKVKASSSCDSCSSWAVRSIYSLLLEEPTHLSDQMEILFNAAYFCEVPVNRFERVVERVLKI